MALLSGFMAVGPRKLREWASTALPPINVTRTTRGVLSSTAAREDVDALIAKRLASLDDVGAMVKDHIETVVHGGGDTNLTDRQIALQGPELMKRVAAARKIYEDLKKIAEQERSIRVAAAK